MTDDEMLAAMVDAAWDGKDLNVTLGTPSWRRVLAVVKDWLAAERTKALAEAALECERHAKFCKAEAHGGGNFDHLITRSDEATYNAARIRALAQPPSEPAA